MAVSVFIKGRMYDYNNGRFLSVDPFIQAPTSTQSMNPYTYILNNPLSGIDPSGYMYEQGFTGNWQSAGFAPGNSVADFRSEEGKSIINLDGSFVDNGKDSSGVDGAETKSSPNKNISDFGSPTDTASITKDELRKRHKIQQKQFSECKAITVRQCSGGITPKQLEGASGNPTGTGKPDRINPNFEGKVVISDSKIEITVNYSSKGDAKSNKRAIRNLRKEYKAANVILNFNKVDNPDDANIILFSATFSDIYQMCIISSCSAAYKFGGKLLDDGKTLLINSANSDDLSDIVAHEFGHALGLMHREDFGIMDYKGNPDRKGAAEKVLKSDVERIKNLYDHNSNGEENE